MSISFVASIVLLLSVICFVKCDTKIFAPSKNPDHPNKCWDEASQTAYSVGSHNPKGSCQRIHCYPDFRVKYTSCGIHSAALGYTIEQDLTKDYPECCAKLVKVAKKTKSDEYIDANSVRINKFRLKERLAEKATPKGKKLEAEVPEVRKTGIEAPKVVLKKAQKPEKLAAPVSQNKNDGETEVPQNKDDKVSASENGNKKSIPMKAISESANKNAKQPESKEAGEIEGEQTTPMNSEDEITKEKSE